MKGATPGRPPLAMIARRLWPDRNPLRRTADRAEFAVLLLLLAAVLVGAPLAGLAAAGWVTSSGLRAERAQASWHRVAAVLLRDARIRPAAGLALTPSAARVPARWASPLGYRTGAIEARSGARAGSTVMVWIDRSGRLTGPPLRAAEVASDALQAAISASLALVLVLLAAWRYAGVILDRQRMAAWDADWLATEPLWTGRH